MNQRVHKAMEHWLEAIKFVQDCRKQEIANAIKRQKENPHCILAYDDNGECCSCLNLHGKLSCQLFVVILIQ